MRPRGSKHELEVRRRGAVALRKRGLTVREVARVVGCAPASVVRWERMFDRAGPDGLKPGKHTGGVKPKLSAEDLERLREQLLRGARAHGWHNELWTLSRVRKLIEELFGVTHHISQVHRLMVRMGFSAQRPARRAREQSVEQVEAFRRKRWPALKKKRGVKDAASS